MYYIILNNDTEASYREELEFTTLENAALQKPHDWRGDNYKIAVGPFMNEIVLIKAFRGVSFQQGNLKQKVVLGNNSLR